MRHVRHVDLRLVQLLLVGCYHLHHGAPGADDLITLALRLCVEHHDVGGKAIVGGVEADIVRGPSCHGLAVSAKSEGNGFAKVVPWDFANKGIHLVLLDNAGVAVGC